jgi:tetratricopeptide (TPR) repeat protein
MRKIHIVFLLLSFSFLSNAQQSDLELANDLTYQAIAKMDSGLITESIELLEKAKTLDPDSFIYDYEIGYAYLMDQDYKSSIKHLKKTLKFDNVNDQCYQMLGNAYDISGNPKKALKIYDQGLEVFPNSGRLYLEKGIVYAIQKNYAEAIIQYEKGITAEPNYPSNYYRAAEYYLNTKDEVWGMIYGEIFLNLERDTDRTSIMSQALYSTYKSEIDITSDTSLNVSFASNEIIITEDDLKKTNENFILSMSVTTHKMYYESTLGMAVVDVDSINLESLNRIRDRFIDLYYQQSYDEKFPVVLFEYQKKIKDLGYLEPYNYWVLSEGDPDGFNQWAGKNIDLWNNFIDWFIENPIEINHENKFSNGVVQM